MNGDGDKKKKVYQKSCNFIVLNDYHLFANVKKPDGATNYMLWYDKVGDDFWGFTMKATPSGESWDKNHIWKASWINDENGYLKPTKESVALSVENITGDLYETLHKIVKEHKEKYKKKQQK